jgi:putative nucleotidyltransferase with HDIG domain
VVLSARDPKRSGAAHITRYLPHAVLATTFVVVLPAVAVRGLVPSGGPLTSLLSVLAALVLSVAAASAASAFWARRPGSRDVLFADLMLWGWLRRLRTERRLREARKLVVPAPGLPIPGPAGIPRRVAALKRLSDMLEARDPDTLGHARRVTRHAERIARSLHLSPAEVAKVRTAAALHDVGKIHTPPEILNKADRLTEQEFEVIKRHPVDGADMLSGIGDGDVTAMVRHHHERLDGTGYPDGLAGDQIPLGARIIAVADTFDAMTSRRAYHGACSHKRALDVLSEEAGTRLDAEAVSAFLAYYSGRTSVAWSAVVTAAPQRLVGWLGSTSERLGAGAASLGHVLPAAGAAAVLVAPVPTGGPAVRVASPETRQLEARPSDGSTRATASASGVEGTTRARRKGAGTAPADQPVRRGDRAPRRPEGSREPQPPAAAPGPGTAPRAASPPVAQSPAPAQPEARLPEAPLPSVEAPSAGTPTVDPPPQAPPGVEILQLDVPPVALPELTSPGSPVESLLAVPG